MNHRILLWCVIHKYINDITVKTYGPKKSYSYWTDQLKCIYRHVQHVEIYKWGFVNFQSRSNSMWLRRGDNWLAISWLQAPMTRLLKKSTSPPAKKNQQNTKFQSVSAHLNSIMLCWVTQHQSSCIQYCQNKTYTNIFYINSACLPGMHWWIVVRTTCWV